MNVIHATGSILVADTRYSTGDGSSFRILSDSTQKIFRLTKHAAVGFTGNYRFAMELKTIAESDKIKKLYFADRIAEALKEKAVALHSCCSSSSDPNIQFIVTGMTSVGTIGSYTIQSSEQYQLNEYVPGSTIKYVCLCNTPSDRFEKRILEVTQKNGGITEQQLYDLMVEHIYFVAKCNQTVNTNTTYIYISI